MNAATSATRVSVLKRLRDLRDWAAFIRESLSPDQPFEPGTRELIVAYMGEAFLRDFESDSQRLIEKLDQMINRIVSTAKPFEQMQSPPQ